MGKIDIRRQRTLNSYRVSPGRFVSIVVENEHDGEIFMPFPSRRHCLEGESRGNMQKLRSCPKQFSDHAKVSVNW